MDESLIEESEELEWGAEGSHLEKRKQLTQRLDKVREGVEEYLHAAVESPITRVACIEEVAFLARSVMVMHDLVRADIVSGYKDDKPKQTFKLEEFEAKIEEWWENTENVASQLNNEARFRFLLYRMFLEGLSAVCSLEPKSMAAQLFKKRHKRQATLSRVNAFIRAVVEAYWEKHMTMTRKELDHQLKSIKVSADWARRGNVKPTKEMIRDVKWNCRFLINEVLKEYSWGGIQLTPECKFPGGSSKL